MNTDQILQRIAREEFGTGATFRESGRAVWSAEVTTRALRRAFEAGQEAMVYDLPDGVAAAHLAHVDPPEGEQDEAAKHFQSVNGLPVKLGDTFVNTEPVCFGHGVRLRGGHVWYVIRFETADDGCPMVVLEHGSNGLEHRADVEELTHEFERQTEARSE